MRSDIELGDDESITLVCADVRARAPVGGRVNWRGDLQLRDRVWITVPDFYRNDDRRHEEDARALLDASGKLDPSSDLGRAAASLGAYGAPGTTTVATIGGSSVEFTGGGTKVVSSKMSVFDALRGERTVDLARELATLRAAILELYDRMGGGK